VCGVGGNGGVIGISFGMGFINPKDAEKLRLATDTESEAPTLSGKALDEYAAENAHKLFGTRTKVVATVEDVADHIDHAVKTAGIDHVGIGSDFDGIAATANGLEDVSKMPVLVAVLLERGYSETDLKKILAGNFLRVIREVTGGETVGKMPMKTARIQRFGPASAVTIDDLAQPEPGARELLVRVKAAGVGHWDALVREGKVQGEPLPLILGAELSGIIEAIGPGVSGFKAGDEVYGATNEHFTGGYAEYALPSTLR